MTTIGIGSVGWRMGQVRAQAVATAAGCGAGSAGHAALVRTAKSQQAGDFAARIAAAGAAAGC